MKIILPALAVALAISIAAPIASAVTAGPIVSDSTVDRSKPRVPGGSGCDDPRDLIEHPECRR